MAEERYTLAGGKSDGELIDTVNDLIEKGWSPVGGPLVTQRDGEPVFLQAVVRAAKSRPKREISLQK
jgi:hypothetical protein